MYNYFVCRFGTRKDGSVLNAIQGFENEADAWKLYWKVLAQAIDSDNLSDALTIMTKGGFQLDYKGFEHEPIVEPIEENGEGGEE